jgi:RNA polymerase sigma-70 factor (ECF subfamily)
MMNEQDRARLEQDARAACARGDHDGAATLALKGYGPEIFGFLVAVHRDEALANDSFSEFAEGLWRSLPGFAWNCSLRTWSYAIARHVTRMARRGAARRDRRAPRVGASALDDVAEAVRSATLTYLRTEKRTKIDALKDALSPEDRALLVLRVDRGLAWNDLARVLAEEEGGLDDAALTREAARLRKRYQLVKDRLRELAGKGGIAK